MKILIINGPNLNMLGTREPEIYGSHSYYELIEFIKDNSTDELEFFQSNIEGEIINKIHEAKTKGFEGIVINPGAYAHYSYAIYDALKCITIPKVEVHLTDINNREDFRKNLVTAKACDNMICGLGFIGYLTAIKWLNSGFCGTTCANPEVNGNKADAAWKQVPMYKPSLWNRFIWWLKDKLYG